MTSLYAGSPQDYSRPPQDIVNLYAERRSARSPIIAQMDLIRRHANGEILVPLPEMDRDEKSFVANLIQTGLDSISQRIGDRMPDLTCPPTDARSKRSQERADVRRKANLWWWEQNGVARQMRRRARWLVGYGSAPVAIRPDFERGIPTWQPRNPLGAYPAPTLDPDDLCPSDMIYATQRTLGWLRSQYPDAALAVQKPTEKADTLLTVLEYEDAEQLCRIVIGNAGFGGVSQVSVLDCLPNRIGVCTSVMPGRITLDRLAGQFDGLPGMAMMRAKLMAMEVLAVQRAVFPDVYLIGRQGETPRYISGPHPGSSGLVNEIEGGDIKEFSTAPGFTTFQAIDRLERAERQAGGIPAELNGESAGNIRTGRRGTNVLSSAIDPGIQEAQETFAYSMQEENYRATKIAKAYFGNQPKSFFLDWKGARGNGDYTPVKDFDSCYTSVKYPMAGTGSGDFVVEAGQRRGMGTMSDLTFMRLDPYIDDPELESDQITSEGLKRAMLESIQQQAAAGTIPPNDLARIMQLVVAKDMDLADAILTAQKEAQERQAAKDAEGQNTAVDPLSPEAQPGLAAPGMGAEAGVAIAESPTALGRLDGFLKDMRSTGAGAGTQ